MSTYKTVYIQAMCADGPNSYAPCKDEDAEFWRTFVEERNTETDELVELCEDEDFLAYHRAVTRGVELADEHFAALLKRGMDGEEGEV